MRPDLSVIREHLVPSEAAQAVIDILTKDTLDVWVYGAKDWYVKSRHGPHVDREEWTVKFPPTVVSTYEGLLDRVVKIVGVSDDHGADGPLRRRRCNGSSVSTCLRPCPNRITWT